MTDQEVYNIWCKYQEFHNRPKPIYGVSVYNDVIGAWKSILIKEGWM